jgi:capsular exopolysaccharide synthesis family protein
VHRAFKVHNRLGLSNILTGQKDFLEGCISNSSVPNVYLLLAGPLTPSPAELLESPEMEAVLQDACQYFDYVVLDSAPLLHVFDSHTLTARANATVFVLRAGQTPRSAVKTSVDLVERVGGKLSGVVMNGVNLDDYAQNYYYASHTHEYGVYPSADATAH